MSAFFQDAVDLWWTKKSVNASASGGAQGGSRNENLSGNTMDGFAYALKRAAIANNYPSDRLFVGKQNQPDAANVPSVYRASKTLDLIALRNPQEHQGLKRHLDATCEMKSQKGSVGNNQNNRIEEALGSAHDLHASWAAGLFGDGPRRPFFGYVFVMDRTTAMEPVRVNLPHFPAAPEFAPHGGPMIGKFAGLSYVDRYRSSFLQMVNHGLYDAVCLIVSEPPAPGQRALCIEPEPLLGSDVFLQRFLARLS